MPWQGQATSIETELLLADVEDAVDAGFSLTPDARKTLHRLLSVNRDGEIRARVYYALGRDDAIHYRQGRSEEKRISAEKMLLKARQGGLSPGRLIQVLSVLMDVGTEQVRKDAARDYLNQGRNKVIREKARVILEGQKGPAKTHSTILTEIRNISNKDWTRVVLFLSQAVTPKFSFLPEDKRNNLPPRLYLDLDGARLDPAVPASKNISDGLLEKVRAAQNDADTVRVVLDFTSYDRYQVIPFPGEARIVIDVYGSKGVSKPNEPLIVEGQKGRQQIVIVDAGHGGKDPGAIGAGKRLEKDVVLRVAKETAGLLAKAGYEVHYTRKDDTFLELFERTAEANKVNADLFLSIHANASESKKPHGYTTYFLAEPSDASAQRVAARENNVKVAQLNEVDMLKQALIFSFNKNESHVFAKSVHEAVVKRIRNYEPFKDSGVKSAPFYVMYGAQMPSILVEVGFISHPKEAKKLFRKDYIKDLSRGLVDGVNKYFKGIKARKL